MRSALAPDVAETFKILAGLATLTDGLPKDAERMVFEGAQGVLLDEDFGWHPHTTGSKTTSANARILLADAGVPDERITHIGCVRAYGTRHGAGPFVGEDPGFDFDEPHNSAGAWQGQWRQGYLDLVALRYAVDCDPHVDGIALSHLDRLDGMAHWPVISEYENLPGGRRIPVPKSRDEQAHLGACMNSIETVVAYVEAADLVHEIRNACGRRVAYTASGPTHQDRVQHGRLNVATTGINSRVMAGPCPFPNLVKA
jgi:adenylosuccinate synthase